MRQEFTREELIEIIIKQHDLYSDALDTATRYLKLAGLTEHSRALEAIKENFGLTTQIKPLNSVQKLIHYDRIARAEAKMKMKIS